MKPGRILYRTFAGFVVALSLAVSTSQIQGTILLPGTTVVPVPMDLVGGAMVDQLILPYVGADIQGTLTSSVFQNDPYNPLGGLTFAYQIAADVTSSAAISRFTVGNYGGFATDVAFSSSVGFLPVELPPDLASRSVVPGNIIRFDFLNAGLNGGQYSATMLVRTDSPLYAPSLASLINAGSAEVGSFAPIAVPEPSTLGLLTLGAAALLLRRRR